MIDFTKPKSKPILCIGPFAWFVAAFFWSGVFAVVVLS